MTLDETFSFGLIHFSNVYVLIGLASFHETIGIDHDTARTLIFINSVGKVLNNVDHFKVKFRLPLVYHVGFSITNLYQPIPIPNLPR